MCNCVIVDNDKGASKKLKMYIENDKKLSLMNIFTNSSDALSFLEKHNIDLIFIDTQIPDFLEFNLLDKVKTTCKIVFTTADTSFAIKAFDFFTIDFLVKPITEQRFQKTITKIKHFNLCNIPMKMLANQFQFHKSLKILSGQRKWQIASHTILFAESIGEYVRVWYNTDQSIITLKTLKDLYEELPKEKFIQIHKSYIISLDYIKSYNYKEVELYYYSKPLPIGRKYKSNFKEFIKPFTLMS